MIQLKKIISVSILFVLMTLSSCDAIQRCCEKECSPKQSQSTCESCGKTSCDNTCSSSPKH